MASLGTPTVIGTISNATSLTTYTVPITATTGLSDYIGVVVGSSGGGSNNIPSSITDSQGQTYTLYTSTTGVGQLSYWRVFNSKVLTNTDTLTVTFPVANSNLKNVIVIDVPGATFEDPSALATNSGSSTNPNVPTEAAFPVEVVLYLEQNGTGGGSPTGFSPFTNISILHSGSNEYTSASYNFTTPGSLTPQCTITSSTWSGITVGLTGAVPVAFIQQPFLPTEPPSLVFNPSYSFKQTQPSYPVPTVISSASVNIPGAQSNTIVNGVNFLTGNNTNFASGQGNWTNGGGTTIAQVGSPSHNAAGALQLTATGAGSINALSSTAGKITTAGVPCNPGDIIFVAGWFLASTTGRTCIAGVSFLDINAGTGPGTVNTTSVTDNTTTWVLGIGEVVAPANAVWARANMQVNSVANTEQHLISDVWLFNVTSGAGMGEQIQIFTPSNQQFQLQPTGIPRPLFLNGTLQFLPRQVQTAPFSYFLSGTTGNMNVAAPPGTPAILQTFFPQFPFPPVTPLSMQVNPSLSWLQPQHGTGNLFVNIDGGNGGQVAVNANFADISVVVSVSATTNVSVVAPTPQIVVTGVTANVNVQARNGTITETLPGTVANVNVAAVSGSISEALSGTVANVSVQARAGTVVVTPVGAAANVNVTMAGDNVVVITMGTVANVAVASVASSRISPQGTVANVTAAAIAGSVTAAIPGTPANVTVATVEGVTISITGTVANVSLTAPPGIAGPVTEASGPTANITVSTIAAKAIAVPGTTANVSVTAVAGSVPRSITGITANVTVVSNPGLDGNITITGFLVNPDLAEDMLLSDKGKLLSDPVTNMLVSATQLPEST